MVSYPQLVEPATGTTCDVIEVDRIADGDPGLNWSLEPGSSTLPTIYREYVPGTRHIRALCCGDEVHAASIESTELDWRGNLNVPSAPYHLDTETSRRLGEVLRLPELRMGVFDDKVDETGQAVFLELNPQGQFLFVEGLTGLDLTDAFARFLTREALATCR